MDKDLQFTWKEKLELHTLESQQLFFKIFLMLSVQGAEINQQEILAKFAELRKQNKLVKPGFSSRKWLRWGLRVH